MNNNLYSFKKIEYFQVLEIESWHYNGFEKSIYMDRYHESYKRGDNPLKGPNGCYGYVAYNSENKLFGLMEYYVETDGTYLGLAINPDYIGKGLSTKFILEGIEFYKENFNNRDQIKIEVHRKNIQGIKAYEKCGMRFRKKDEDILLYTF